MMAMPIVTGIDVAKAEYTDAAWSWRTALAEMETCDIMGQDIPVD